MITLWNTDIYIMLCLFCCLPAYNTWKYSNSQRKICDSWKRRFLFQTSQHVQMHYGSPQDVVNGAKSIGAWKTTGALLCTNQSWLIIYQWFLFNTQCLKYYHTTQILDVHVDHKNWMSTRHFIFSKSNYRCSGVM